MKQIAAFESSDGTIFKSESEAIAHDEIMEWAEFYRKIDPDLSHRIGESDIKKIVSTWECLKATKQKENIKDQPISILNLTERTNRCLHAENITTVGSITQYTEDQMLKTPNLGRKALNEIKDALSGFGLSFHQ